MAQKPLLARISGLRITFLACVIGAVACLPFAPGLVDEAGRAGTGALVWAVHLGAVPTAIGFTTWPTRSRARPPAGWAPPRTSCRR